MSLHTLARRGWLTAVLAVTGCGDGGSSNPTAPTSPGGGGPALTISIVANRGAQSFAPNPAILGQSPTFGWRNNDNDVHRLVANDGSFDTGNIAPGALSRALATPAMGANYHCSLHPTMVGSIGVQGQAPPACTGQYC